MLITLLVISIQESSIDIICENISLFQKFIYKFRKLHSIFEIFRKNHKNIVLIA